MSIGPTTGHWALSPPVCRALAVLIMFLMHKGADTDSIEGTEGTLVCYNPVQLTWAKYN